ncbi:MAG: MmgE/PrpD family protein, partial [Methanobrevibacter sp.]|nr:MmgE/PrpD family protein [Methanobrevibacter sp.]
MISEEIAKKISKFIVDLKYEDIPEIAIKKAKICLVDYLAVRNRGMKEESTKIAIKTMNQLLYSSYSSYSQYSQYSLQGSPLIEGFINGIASHTLDFDDGHKIAQLHPGTVVFSSAIAISKDKSANITGKEFLEAIIVGYEIAILLGEIANPHHRNQGFHSTGTIGTFAAGATIAKLLKLNISQTIATLGLCGTQSGGLLESDHQGTMGKSLHVGNAVYNGILSAFLAKNGFSAPKSIVGGKEGFLKAMAKDSYDELNEKIAKNNSYLSDYLNQELGKFHITEVYFKKYPVCRHLHSAIDSIIALRSKLIEKYNNSDKNSSFENIVDKIINTIDEIAIETYKIAAEHNNYDPKTKEDLKQSLPYSIAIAFVFGDLNLDILDNFNIYNNSNT